jgi:peptide/nickel transport system substrate-binding protein
VAALAATAMLLGACAESDRSSDEGSGGDGDTATQGGTFVFAGSAEPVTLDPVFASDGESFRVARQIFEGLVGTEPGTADPAPLLATEWTTSEDGLTYNFTLQEGVKFHDGTDFNAEAVCANFERWYNMPESAQTDDLTYYYGKLFRGFATGDNADKALFESCTPNGESEVEIKLTAPFAGFISAMSLPAFSMQSPTALEEYQDDAASDPRTTEYSTAHPTGTGPFTLGAWNRGEDVTLEANDDYWGEKPLIDKAIVVAIDDTQARATALENGEIDGYDLVGPADIATLEEGGFTIANREPFNVLYLGFNQAQEPFDDPKFREALAYAINKDEIVSASLPEGSLVATQFVPPTVNGFSEEVEEYPHDPDMAKQLLDEGGWTGETVEFNYPTDVSRPYMPSPEDTFNVIRSQLEAVGLKVKPVADKWDPDYLDKILGTDKHGMHLLGWTGDYNDTDNFLGVFFGTATDEWGFENQELFDALSEARAIPTVEEQTSVYQQINEDVMEFIPGIPIAHPVPSLAFDPKVEGYQPSPVQDEVWNTISISE